MWPSLGRIKNHSMSFRRERDWAFICQCIVWNECVWNERTCSFEGRRQHEISMVSTYASHELEWNPKIIKKDSAVHTFRVCGVWVSALPVTCTKNIKCVEPQCGYGDISIQSFSWIYSLTNVNDVGICIQIKSHDAFEKVSIGIGKVCIRFGRAYK